MSPRSAHRGLFDESQTSNTSDAVTSATSHFQPERASVAHQDRRSCSLPKPCMMAESTSWNADHWSGVPNTIMKLVCSPNTRHPGPAAATPSAPSCTCTQDPRRAPRGHRQGRGASSWQVRVGETWAGKMLETLRQIGARELGLKNI